MNSYVFCFVFVLNFLALNLLNHFKNLLRTRQTKTNKKTPMWVCIKAHNILVMGTIIVIPSSGGGCITERATS